MNINEDIDMNIEDVNASASNSASASASAGASNQSKGLNLSATAFVPTSSPQSGPASAASLTYLQQQQEQATIYEEGQRSGMAMNINDAFLLDQYARVYMNTIIQYQQPRQVAQQNAYNHILSLYQQHQQQQMMAQQLAQQQGQYSDPQSYTFGHQQLSSSTVAPSTPRQPPRSQSSAFGHQQKSAYAAASSIQPQQSHHPSSAIAAFRSPSPHKASPLSALKGVNFIHMTANLMQPILSGSEPFPRNSIVGDFGPGICFNILNYLYITTNSPHGIRTTEAFIILNNNIFYGYTFKYMERGIAIHGETFLILNLFNAIMRQKITGVKSITVYSTLQPCCMCSLIIHQAIMSLRNNGFSIDCQIYYSRDDKKMEYHDPSDLSSKMKKRASYWNDVSTGKNKTGMFNWFCLPGAGTKKLNYNLHDLFQRTDRHGTPLFPKSEKIQQLIRKEFHSIETKRALLNEYIPHIEKPIPVVYITPKIRKQLLDSNTQTAFIQSNEAMMKVMNSIDYFYINATGEKRTQYKRQVTRSSTGRQRHILAQGDFISTFLGGFTLTNIDPDCNSEEGAGAGAGSKEGSPALNLRGCSIPSYQVDNLIGDPIDLNELYLEGGGRVAPSAAAQATGKPVFNGGFTKTKKNKKKRRKNKKTIKKKRKNKKTIKKKRKNKKTKKERHKNKKTRRRR